MRGACVAENCRLTDHTASVRRRGQERIRRICDVELSLSANRTVNLRFLGGAHGVGQSGDERDDGDGGHLVEVAVQRDSFGYFESSHEDIARAIGEAPIFIVVLNEDLIGLDEIG